MRIAHLTNLNLTPTTMSNPTVNFPFEVSYKLWEQLFVTAIEGGINYWASINCRTAREIYPDEPFSIACAKYFWDGVNNGGEVGGGMYVHAIEGDDMSRIIFFQDFLDGIAKCLQNGHFRSAFVSNETSLMPLSEDLGMIDAGVADAWFQYSCYGEIIYG